MSDSLERIEAAEAKFEGTFGGMESEWDETFYAATRFARGLVDCQPADKPLLDAVLAWIEESAALQE